MSLDDINASLAIIEENFGKNVAAVAKKISTNGSVSLKTLVHELSNTLSKPQVQKAVITLVSHKYVSSSWENQRIMVYTLDAVAVISSVMKPLIVQCVKDNYGILASLIMVHVFKHGCYELGMLLEEVTNIGQAGDMKATIEAFKMIAEHQCVVQMLPVVTQPSEGLSVNKIIPQPDSTVPITEDILEQLCTSIALIKASGKRIHRELQDIDSKIYVCAGLEPALDLVCEEIICGIVRHKFDHGAASIVKVLFKLQRKKSVSCQSLSSTSTISFAEILSNLPLTPYIDESDVSGYLKMLVDDQNGGIVTFIDSKIIEGYSIDVTKALRIASEDNLCWLISERYGTSSRRIFRLLLDKIYLEQKQISDLSMTPFKQAKEALYKMYQDGFVELQAVPKTPDSNPLTAVYLFTVNFSRCVLEAIQLCKKFISKIIQRRMIIYQEINILIQKNPKACSEIIYDQTSPITLRCLVESEGKLFQLLTQPELMELQAKKNAIGKLDYAEVNVARSLLIFQSYIRYSRKQLNQNHNKK